MCIFVPLSSPSTHQRASFSCLTKVSTRPSPRRDPVSPSHRSFRSAAPMGQPPLATYFLHPYSGGSIRIFKRSPESVVPDGPASLRSLLLRVLPRGKHPNFHLLFKSLLKCKGRVSDYRSLTSDHLHPRWIVFVPSIVVIDQRHHTALVEKSVQEIDARNPASHRAISECKSRWICLPQ